MRSCIGCARTGEKKEFVRFVIDGGKLVADIEGSLKGRGAYLCRSVQCADAALKKGLFSRAFKITVEAPSRDDLITWVGAHQREGK